VGGVTWFYWVVIGVNLGVLLTLVGLLAALISVLNRSSWR
jgi:hypothetical protein